MRFGPQVIGLALRGGCSYVVHPHWGHCYEHVEDESEDYAEQVFTHLEENLKSLTGTVTRCRQQLNEGAAQQNGQW